MWTEDWRNAADFLWLFICSVAFGTPYWHLKLSKKIVFILGWVLEGRQSISSKFVTSPFLLVHIWSMFEVNFRFMLLVYLLLLQKICDSWLWGFDKILYPLLFMGNTPVVTFLIIFPKSFCAVSCGCGDLNVLFLWFDLLLELLIHNILLLLLQWLDLWLSDQAKQAVDRDRRLDHLDSFTM